MKNGVLSLIGHGWLGRQLAPSLEKVGFDVLRTTAHDKSDGSVTLDLKQDPIVPSKILKSETLIYMVPPLELANLKHFFDQIPKEMKVIFISSTSVYGKHLGDVSESTPIDAGNTSSPLLLETEAYLKKQFKNLTILRLGGLYGLHRHPVFFLQGKKDLRTGEEFLHLAHAEDCIKAINEVLSRDIWNETFNIISDLRIKKRDYYETMAKNLGLLIPEYQKSGILFPETRISNDKSKMMLGMTYLDPNGFCTSSE